MARTMVTLDRREMRKLLTSSKVRDDLTKRGERVLRAAQSSAPVATGAYRDGLHIVQATTDRAVVRIAGDTDHDWIVEADTGNLSRALDQAK